MDLIQQLQDKDNKKAYDLMKKTSKESSESNKYYSYFDGFISLLSSPNAYVRTRGFILACAQVRWDQDNLLEKNLDTLLEVLNDEKPVVVRQCISALPEVVLYHPEFSPKINTYIEKIDLTKYPDSMRPLIKKYIQELKRSLNI